MKRHNRIFIPVPLTEETATHLVMTEGGTVQFSAVEENGVLVITIEEAPHIFNAGMNYVKEQSVTNGVDFPAYMESKGIKTQE